MSRIARPPHLKPIGACRVIFNLTAMGVVAYLAYQGNTPAWVAVALISTFVADMVIGAAQEYHHITKYERGQERIDPTFEK